MIDLKGKNVLVMGGTSGIGASIALAFAKSGANVIASSRDPQKVAHISDQIESLGAQTLRIEADATISADLERVYEQIGNTWGRLDSVVNCQGVTIKCEAEQISDSLYDRLHDLNMKSVFRSCRTAFPLLKASQGSVVNIASIGGLLALRNSSVYSACKAAVAHLTKALALEWAEYGIRCNTIAPGWIMTPLSEPILNDPKYKDTLLAKIPLKRFGNADEIAGIALFLASDLASYCTGSVVVIDGGATAGI